jgi:hypothetical protein
MIGSDVPRVNLTKIPFRLVHDIAELLTVLEQNGLNNPS